ncbi:hypothetical protein ACTBIB_005190 [Klebsiella pneumoniae]
MHLNLKVIGIYVFGIIQLLMIGNANAFNSGMNVHPATFPNEPFVLLQTLKKYNIDSFRVDYSWQGVEKKKGVYKIPDSKLENAIQLGIKEGVTPLIILYYGNSNYKENTGGHKNIRLSSDEEIEGFINYVDWVSKHFGKKKIIFEIWNEWNHSKPKYNNNSLESALDYVALVKKSSAIIKRNNPNAIIIAGGFNPLSRKEMNWGKEIVLNGIMTYVDGLSIHPYDWTHKQITPANISLDKIRKAHDELLSYSSGHEVNLYITEVGVSSFSKNLFTDTDIGQYLVSYYIEAKKNNFIKGVWWYCFVNKGTDPSDFESNFGILNVDGSPKPAASFLYSLPKN